MRVLEASINDPPFYPGLVKRKMPHELHLHEQFAVPREERGFTQQALAEMVEMHIFQIRRCEAGQSQPTLDAIRKLEVALSVSADMLFFAHDKCGPKDDLKIHFEAAGRRFSTADTGGSSR